LGETILIHEFHSLPWAYLSFSHGRRGEEHSFILKPASSEKDSKVHKKRLSPSCGLHLVPNTVEGRSALNADQHAIMVSCRCNYTAIHYFCGLLRHLNYLKCLFIYFHQPFVSCFVLNVDSRLFFKQPTSWRPNISRDLLISVASEMSGQSSVPNGKVSQLPVQVVLLLHFFHCVENVFFSSSFEAVVKFPRF